MDAIPAFPQSLSHQADDSLDWTDETLLTRRPPPPADAPPSSLAIPMDADPAPPSPESTEAAEGKRRDSVPVLTSGEADDVDIDALLAEERTVVPASLSSQLPANQDEPAAADDSSGVIASKEAAHIADNEFEDARGRPASMHPESGESAGISHDDLVRADIVMRLKKAHVTLAEPDKVPLPALQHMETVLLDGNWIGDEPALREVMLITLAALDHATYGDKPQNVTEGPIAELTHVFLHELHKNKVLSAVRLEAIKPKKGIVLPPLPSPPLRSEPRAGSPPRPGRKR